MMQIDDFLMIVIKNLKQRQTRSWLTVLGVVIGIAAIVSLISISQGLENAITEQFSKMGTDTVFVVPKGYQGPTLSIEALTDDDVDFIGGIRGVDYVAGTKLKSTTIEYSNEERFLTMNGYSSDVIDRYFEDNDFELSEGRVLKKGERGSVVIGGGVAENVFEKEVRLRSTLLISGSNFKVVGILDKTGLPGIDNQMITTLEDIRRISGGGSNVDSIVVHVEEGYDVDEVSDNIEAKMKRRRDSEDFEVYPPTEILEQLGAILGVLSFVLGGIAAISLLVGGIGIMNSMYTSVLERTRQIGVMKAIGAKKVDILSIFLIEAGLIGLVGGIAGLIIGSAVAYSVGFIAKALNFPLLLIRVEFGVLFGALSFAFIVGVVSGVLPALRAANLIPVEALRYE